MAFSLYVLGLSCQILVTIPFTLAQPNWINCAGRNARIDWSGNNLKHFPNLTEELSNCTKSVDVSQNEISGRLDFPMETIPLYQAGMLLLHDNQLDSVHGISLAKAIPGLKLLDLRANKFAKITLESFQNLFYLTTLYLSRNHISHIDSDSFRDLNLLTNLKLSHNSLVVIEDTWLKPLVSLSNLEMDYNLIQKFIPVTFTWPLRLQQVNLRNNNIGILPPLLSLNEYYLHINVKENAIFCGCHQYMLSREILKGKNVQFDCIDKKDTNPSSLKDDRFWTSYLETPLCQKIKITFDTCCVKGTMCYLQCQANGVPLPIISIYRLGRVGALAKSDGRPLVAYGPLRDYTDYICRAQNEVETYKQTFKFQERQHVLNISDCENNYTCCFGKSSVKMNNDTLCNVHEDFDEAHASKNMRSIPVKAILTTGIVIVTALVTF